MAYINKAELVENLDRFAPEHLTPLIRTLIEKQPTADVVEVVRCKDCKYFFSNGKNGGSCDLLLLQMENNDYCSYGAKMDKEE